jgi:anti-sigma factor ChrR (cupin superfamily)
MLAAAAVNADSTQCAVVDTNRIPWVPTAQRGMSIKVLERINDPVKGRESALFKLAPGTRLPTETLKERLEIFVLEGSFSDEHGSYGEHTWMRNYAGFTLTISSKDGCVFYAKRRVPIYRDEAQRSRIVIDAKTAKWLEFPHRGADVLHLYKDPNGLETGRIGNVHTDRKIPSHNHSIGEETFVIEGCLKDEYAAYGKGVWFRMPCGVPHAPYTESEHAKMLIREGDLVW